MAHLSRKNGVFVARFRYRGKEYKKSLKTGDRRDAEAALLEVRRAIHRLTVGLLAVPDGIDPGDFIVSGGTLRAAPQADRTARPLTVAIRSPGGEFLGTVTARLGLEVLTEVFARNVRILQMQRDPPTRIEWQFLADDGRVLAESSRKQDDTVNLKALQLPSAILSDSTQPGYVEELDARRHVPVVTGYAQTTGIDESQRPHWRVLVRVDRSDILAPTRVLLTRLGMAEALVLLPLVVLLRWIIAQRKRTELAVLRAHDELEQRVQERTAQLLNATEALQESEARWRAISELTSDWAYAYRRQADGGLLLEWVTGAFARITGFTLEEVQAILAVLPEPAARTGPAG